jgi:hypothetical protein
MVASDFNLAKDIGTAEAWDAFLAKYGSLTGNFHVDLAKAARQKLTAFSPTQAPVTTTEENQAKPGAAKETEIPNQSAETGKARKYTLASLGQDADSRLARAVEALPGQEIRFGYFKDHLYIAVLISSIDWNDSKELAERAGGHLVTITSKEENEFVAQLFAKDERFTWLEAGKWVHGPWIGLLQVDGAREPKGGWRWITGEPMKFANWNPGNPDNYIDPYFSAGQNRGVFFAKKGRVAVIGRVDQWDDCYEKGEQRGFVMEVE